MAEVLEHSCRFAGPARPRMLRAHETGCDTAGCQGCRPCPERHCRLCGKTHVTVDGRGGDETCASCIGEIRDHLRGIYAHSTRLLGEAIIRGINSQATMLAGPAAEHDAFRRRITYAFTDAGCRDRAHCPRHYPLTASGPICRTCKHPSCSWIRREHCVTVMAIHLDNRDELHPLWVVGGWEMNVRAHLDQHTTERVQLSAATAYLDQHLTALAHDPDFDLDEFAGDLRRCHAYLEDVLREGERAERGAPCPSCGKAPLEKSYGRAEDEDRWSCPRCQEWWTETDYRARVAGLYVGVADRLTASQIRETYRVTESTVRTWAERGKVRRRGKDGQGRMLYDVADVLATRDTNACA